MNTPYKKHSAVIFDLDGVIIDSIPHHKKAWADVSSELEVPFTDEVFESMNGMRNDSIIADVLGFSEPATIERIAVKKEERYRESARKSLEFIEGFETFLRFLNNKGIHSAVATSAPLENVEMVNEVMDLFNMFDVVVRSEEVLRGKPEPDVFLEAARRIGADVAKTVVFEDSLSGITAGKSAGMTVVGLATSHDMEQLERADFVIKHFGDEILRQLF